MKAEKITMQLSGLLLGKILAMLTENSSLCAHGLDLLSYTQWTR